MPGTILSAETRKRIAQCHIHSARIATTRPQLISIYEAARLSLQKGPLFDDVCFELENRAKVLGVHKQQGGKNA